jgi:hypothetical protein
MVILPALGLVSVADRIRLSHDGILRFGFDIVNGDVEVLCRIGPVDRA